MTATATSAATACSAPPPLVWTVAWAGVVGPKIAIPVSNSFHVVFLLNSSSHTKILPNIWLVSLKITIVISNSFYGIFSPRALFYEKKKDVTLILLFFKKNLEGLEITIIFKIPFPTLLQR